MKATIITINDRYNYGNRLQNYAMENTIKAIGWNADTAYVYLTRSGSQNRQFAEIRHLFAPLKHLISIQKHCLGVKGLARWSSFRRFEEGMANTGPSFYSAYDVMPDANTCFVLGSDQIWNYQWISKPDLEMRLGMFAKPDQLVAYAASIGLDEITDGWRETFQEGWSRISHLSVREDRAAELIKEISGREATTVVDPTLLLAPGEWSEIFTGFVPAGDRYVLTYFLGKPTELQEEIIQSFASSLGARVRRLNDQRDRDTYAAGPAEFVELVSRAEYVFTDSYHACCFSILFNKPFKVFNRIGCEGKKSMNSRMKTLFRLFELEDLMADDSAMPVFDWGRIDSLLENRRAGSLAWLKMALVDVAERIG